MLHLAFRLLLDNILYILQGIFDICNVSDTGFISFCEILILLFSLFFSTTHNFIMNKQQKILHARGYYLAILHWLQTHIHALQILCEVDNLFKNVLYTVI